MLLLLNKVINFSSFNEYADKNTTYIRQFQQLLHYAGKFEIKKNKKLKKVKRREIKREKEKERV